MYKLFILLVHFSVGSPTETGEITGTVLDNRNNENFPGVVVELFQGKDLVASNFTDFNGEFAFPNTPTGIYYLTFKFAGKSKEEDKRHLSSIWSDNGIGCDISEEEIKWRKGRIYLSKPKKEAASKGSASFILYP